MRAHGEKLSRKKEQLIAALLTCGSITEAAARCGLAEATVHRWLQDAAFTQAYREARRQVVQQAISQVQQGTGIAVSTLIAILQDCTAPASARVAAARTMLETAIKAVELEDLEARLAALEAQLLGSKS